MNIVIFGGNFDPIHIGHINIARNVAMLYDATVFFVPSKISIWKNNSVSIQDKLNMLKIAIQDYNEFKIDTYEIDNDKQQTYSIETVRYFKKKYPNDKLFFLIGEDQAENFPKWNEAKELSELAKILVYPRNGYKVSYETKFLFNMTVVDSITYDYSSTETREFTHLQLPPKVIDYIVDNDLYFIKKIKSYYTEERFKHALSVARLAIKIAKSNNLLLDSVYGYVFVAGLLHDIGKNVDKDEQYRIMETEYPEYLDMPQFSYHQFVGSTIARNSFNLEEQLVLDAIMYHATGRDNMTTLEKIIYAADKLDPTRGYDSSKLINEICEDLDKGFIHVLSENVNYILSKGKNISNKLTNACLKYYLNK